MLGGHGLNYEHSFNVVNRVSKCVGENISWSSRTIRRSPQIPRFVISFAFLSDAFIYCLFKGVSGLQKNRSTNKLIKCTTKRGFGKGSMSRHVMEPISRLVT